MKLNKPILFAVAAGILILSGPSLPWASPRLEGMNRPVFSLTDGVPTSYPNVLFPTDENNLGIPVIPDRYEIFKFPQSLVDPELFSDNTVVFKYTGTGTGSGGLFLQFPKLLGVPVGAGVFLNRPNQNDWVNGQSRGDLGTLGNTFDADITNQATIAMGTPPAPNNHADVFFAAALPVGLRLGLGAGFAYDKDEDTTTQIDGTADSTTTLLSKTSVIVVRGGASWDFRGLKMPLGIDFGTSVHIDAFEMSYVSGANAALPNQDDTVAAHNTVFDLGTRVRMELSPSFGMNVLGSFARMPQNYAATNDGVPLTTTTDQLDDTVFWSAGGGVSAIWKPKPGAIVEAATSFTYGKGTWIEEAPGAGVRPQDSVSWYAWNGQVGAEMPLTDWLSARGGLGVSKKWDKEVRDLTTGGTDTTLNSYNFDTSASAGLGLKIADPVFLDFTINLSNLTGAGAFQSIALSAAMTATF